MRHQRSMCPEYGHRPNVEIVSLVIDGHYIYVHAFIASSLSGVLELMNTKGTPARVRIFTCANDQ